MSELATEIGEDPFQSSLGMLDFDAKYQDDPVDVRLIYIPFRNGEIDTATFLEFLKDHIFTKFVISCTEARTAYSRKGKDEADDALFRKALRKFSQSTTKGDLPPFSGPVSMRVRVRSGVFRRVRRSRTRRNTPPTRCHGLPQRGA